METTPKINKEINDKQIDDIYEQWKDSSYLEGIPEKHKRKIAVILDNQKIFNDFQPRKCDSKDDEFTKITLKIIQKIFQNSIIPDIVPFQPIMRPTGKVFGTEFKYVIHEDTLEERIHKAVEDKNWTLAAELITEITSGHTQPKITIEIVEHQINALTKNIESFMIEDIKKDYFIDMIADEINKKITREVLTDLRNNVATVMTKKVDIEKLTNENIYINICEMSGIIHRKTMKGGVKWIVTNPELGNKLYSLISKNKIEINGLLPKYVGTVCCAWKLYINPLHKSNEILVGYHDEEQLPNSYFYCPYVFLAKTETIMNSDDLIERRGIMTRFGKKLSNIGPKFFGLIKYEEEYINKGEHI